MVGPFALLSSSGVLANFVFVGFRHRCVSACPLQAMFNFSFCDNKCRFGNGIASSGTVWRFIIENDIEVDFSKSHAPYNTRISDLNSKENTRPPAMGRP